MSSRARVSPTRFTSRSVPPKPGIRPRLISGCPSRARDDAIRRSQASASSRPPPRATPFMTPRTGTGRPRPRPSPRARARRRHAPPGRHGRHRGDVRARRERLLAAPGDHQHAHAPRSAASRSSAACSSRSVSAVERVQLLRAGRAMSVTMPPGFRSTVTLACGRVRSWLSTPGRGRSGGIASMKRTVRLADRITTELVTAPPFM